jgi:benzoyl-CoA reductase/2-hydroxyglutaryl-CoA dehydratase subunit BcrC/BadD/HgdB
MEHTPSAAQRSLQEFVDKAIERLRQRSSPLASLEYFCRRAEEILRPPLVTKARAEGRKVIGYYCALVPAEIIASFDAVPLRLCSGLPVMSRHGLPRDCCPLVSSSTEFINGREEISSPAIDAVVVPTVCDWKSHFAETLSDCLPTLAFQVPMKKREPSARRERLCSLTRLVHFMEHVTGRKLSRRDLWQAIRMYQRASHATRKLSELMRADPPPLPGSALLLVMNVSFFDDIASWTDAVLQLVGEESHLKAPREVSAKRAPRLLLTGAPIIWPNWNVLDVLEESGGSIVTEELCSGVRVFYDPVRIDEPTLDDMLQALAERYSLACTCPCFVPNEDRVYRNVSLARRYDVDGVIYHNLRTCYLYQSEASVLRSAFQELGIPFLEVETDSSREEREQLAVRVEPFIEMLRQKGRRAVG